MTILIFWNQIWSKSIFLVGNGKIVLVHSRHSLYEMFPHKGQQTQQFLMSLLLLVAETKKGRKKSGKLLKEKSNFMESISSK